MFYQLQASLLIIIILLVVVVIIAEMAEFLRAWQPEMREMHMVCNL